MNYADALSFLHSFINYEKGFSKYGNDHYDPDKVGKLLNLANVDYGHIRFAHIAGTNGKGTTARALSSLLNAHGLNVGIYTSPHVFSMTERIGLNHADIAESELADLTAEFGAFLKKQNATFFEVLTFIAMVYFVRKNADVIILETGLGGRLDSTNFCSPDVVVITPVSYDHTALLGDTLAQIAAEKGGIIKSGAPVVIARQKPEARHVLEEIATEKGVPLHEVRSGEEFQIRRRTAEGCFIDADFEVSETRVMLKNFPFPHIGDAFAENFMTALAAYAVLGGKISETVIKKAGRFESPFRLRVDTDYVIDVAHNPAAVDTLLSAVEDYLPELIGDREVHLYIGTLAEKEIERIAAVIRRHSAFLAKITAFDFPTGDSQRKSGGRLIYDSLKDLPNTDCCADIRTAVIDSSEFSILTGSFYAVEHYPVKR